MGLVKEWDLLLELVEQMRANDGGKTVVMCGDGVVELMGGGFGLSVVRGSEGVWGKDGLVDSSATAVLGV